MTELRDTLPRIPNEPGVYRFLDEDGAVLYVGKAKALRKRVSSYFRRGAAAPTGRIAEMVSRARELEWVVTASETEALLLEDNFIKEERPPFNLRLRDDKSYPYIEITLRDEWPRVRFMRGRHVPGNLYFGPFSSARKVRETLELIGRVFPYRKCKGEKPGRASGSPCLQYFINRSLGPCDGRVSHEEYMDVVSQVIDFLRGRLSEVEHSIARDMRVAGAGQEFEKAALLRDRLAAVRHIQERQAARIEGEESFDVIGVHQEEPGANVQVFRVREGALVDRQTFYVANAADRESDTVLGEFLLEFYWEPGAIPAEIVAPVGEGAAEIAAALAARRGAGVELHRAQRGAKRRLMLLAQHNAEMAGQMESERLQRRRAARIDALEGLRDALDLAELPLRIECYDISNLGERHAVGSMVVFEGGLAKKSHYRSFTVRTVAGQDDFAMMREVVRRRFERRVAGPAGAAPPAPQDAPVTAPPAYDESFASMPGLIVVDGGKGQLSAALAGLRDAGVAVPAASLAKQREEVYVPRRSAPLELAPDTAASLLLQRVRNEAHRFAVSHHRRRRDADLRRSTIFDGLPQVGPVRRRRILEHFGSPERFVAASRDELERVPGLPRKVARGIYANLHKAG